jgi:hypothetical protein
LTIAPKQTSLLTFFSRAKQQPTVVETASFVPPSGDPFEFEDTENSDPNHHQKQGSSVTLVMSAEMRRAQE